MNYIYLIAYTFSDGYRNGMGRSFYSTPQPLSSRKQIITIEEQLVKRNGVSTVGVLSFQLLGTEEGEADNE